jgi:hypothetical protein
LEKYLFDAKASAAEVLSRLVAVRRKGYISERNTCDAGEWARS